MYLLGYDIGSSSVKASLVDAETGKCVASSFFPKEEAEIIAVKPGWAEQNPSDWWNNLKLATADVMKSSKVGPCDIGSIGISYQMHGLVCVDKDQNVLRPAIIWCDSRAVAFGNKAFREIGEEKCLSHLLNSPGNFTASKLAWVKQNEPHIFDKIYKIMLPGDYIAMKLTGEVSTTASGLSEAMLWDFTNNKVADFVLDYFGFDASLIPNIHPTFSEQGRVTPFAAAELGLKEGIPVAYRAGDQPNNALSLNVFNVGEIASTAGTSGVVYGVNGNVNYDKLSRVNTFAHVNHTKDLTRLGVLLCINGTGILNSWLKHQFVSDAMSYEEMDECIKTVPIGSQGLSVLPFGNGAERILNNSEIHCNIEGLDFSIHKKAHVLRAAQEGIVFAFKYGIDIMKEMGIPIEVIHAGFANMFMSPVFCETLAGVSGATIELYNTDGSVGSAKGGGMGIGIYKDHNEAFASLEKIKVVEPDASKTSQYIDAYNLWKERLEIQTNVSSLIKSL
jgi:xylulokinase